MLDLNYDIKICIDKNAYSHALLNLLSNAFKYSKGELAPEVSIDVKDNLCLIGVKDFGIGVPKSDLEVLFQPFFRAANTLSIQGTGLGLNIAKEFIENNGGKIIVNSELSKGSYFEIQLPICSV